MPKSLLESLGSFFEMKMQGIHTILPAKILSIEKDRVDASIEAELRSIKSLVQPSPIFNVPVLFLHGKHGGLFHKLKKDDCGIVAVAEADISKWKDTGNIESKNQKKFDLSNSFFIPGIFPQNQNEYLKKIGEAAVSLWAEGDGKLAIYNGESSMKKELKKLYKLLNDLLRHLDSLCTTAIPQNPMSGSAFGTLKPQIAAVAKELSQSEADIEKIFTEAQS
jgi:hypothetical protein